MSGFFGDVHFGVALAVGFNTCTIFYLWVKVCQIVVVFIDAVAVPACCIPKSTIELFSFRRLTGGGAVMRCDF